MSYYITAITFTCDIDNFTGTDAVMDHVVRRIAESEIDYVELNGRGDALSVHLDLSIPLTSTLIGEAAMEITDLDSLSIDLDKWTAIRDTYGRIVIEGRQ